MAHELSIRETGKVEMAYTGETPWHGLGQEVTQGASIGVWTREAGMDWQAKQAPVFYHVSKDKPGSPRNAVDHKVIYRSDTGDALAVMGSKYNIVQPVDVLEFFRDLTEDDGWYIHTAGVLRGGRKLWAMASNGESGEVTRKGSAKDPVTQNLLLATSLDGSMKTIAALTAIRVVCANTLAIALQDSGEKLQVSHRSIFDPSAIKRALGVSHESFKVFMEKAREMADTPIQLDESLDVLRCIFGSPVAQQAPDANWMGKLTALASAPVIPEAKESRVVSRILELFDGAGMGADLKTAKGTRWGLFNAITQHVDQEMGRSDDTRLDSAWFGRGQGFKQQAFEELTT